MAPEMIIAAAYASGWDTETPTLIGTEEYLANVVRM